MILGAPGVAAVLLNAVSKSFGGRPVVDGVSFSVGRGACFGLLGPNGAGKSTTLKMIYGSVPPSAGLIRVEGVDVACRPKEARRRLGVVPQEDTLDSDLTVVENLLFHGRYCGLPHAEARRRADEWLGRMGLGERGGEQVSLLSAGLRRRVVLGRALMNEPSVLVLDEPTRGLDAATRADYLEIVGRLKAAGTAVVLATHDLDEAAALCDAAALMREGRFVRVGEASAVLRAAAADGLPAGREGAG